MRIALRAMEFVFELGPALNVLAGVLLVGLGALVLGLKPRRSPSIAFSAFAILWGIQIGLANLASMAATTATARLLVFTFLAVGIPLYVPLFYLAASYPQPSAGWVHERRWLGALVLPAVAFLGLLALAPDLFVENVTADQGRVTTQGGPLFLALGLFNTRVAFLIALGVIALRARREEVAVSRDATTLLGAALLTYVSFRAADAVGFLLVLPDSLPDLIASLGEPLYAMDAIVGLFGVGAVVATLVLLAPDLRDPWGPLVWAAAIVPFAFGSIEWFLSATTVSNVETLGLWRLGMAGIVAYAIARYRLFDIEVKLRHVSGILAGTLVVLVLSGLLYMTLGDAFRRIPVLGLTAALGVLAVSYPLGKMAPSLVDRLAPWLASPGYLQDRKLDVYQAALAYRRASDGDPGDSDHLAELREELGISETEHHTLQASLEALGSSAHRASDTGRDRFEIESEIGRGSFARALLAYDQRLDRNVVLKEPHAAWIAHEAGRERFLEEARLAAQVNHPSVVIVYEVVEEDPPCMVLEYVEGGSLADRLAREGPPDPGEVVDLADGVLSGLHALHEAGILHRDVKPGNVLIAGDGTAKLTDFSVAAPSESVGPGVTLAASHSHPGSLGYMSPEQIQGLPLDERTDVYSVGVVLYEMLTGEHYLDLAELSEGLARERILEQPPDLDHPRVPEEITGILAQALAKDPEDRFPDAETMRQALAASGLDDPPEGRADPA